MISFSSFPLRCHVTNSMNSCESKSISLFNIPSNLIIYYIRSPLFCDRPSHFTDPLSTASSGYGSICVARVEKYSVLILKDWIDPFWCLVLWFISYLVSTHLPCLDEIRNVKVFSNIFSINPVNNWKSKSARRKTTIS